MGADRYDCTAFREDNCYSVMNWWNIDLDA